MEIKFVYKGIYKEVENYLLSKGSLKGQKVLDCPAGDGRTSAIVQRLEGELTSADLFPEFFTLKNTKCDEVDITLGLPYEDEAFDILICQEGIEHFPDQLYVLEEFARVLKKNGELIITTPNISHVRARWSHFLLETDYYKRTAPSELDGVWFSHRGKEAMYFGHVFLINIQKLRTLGVFTGFEFKKVIMADFSFTSFLLGIVFYPFLLLANLLAILTYSRKFKHLPRATRNKVFWEQFCLNLDPKILFKKHLMVVMKKVRSKEETIEHLRNLTRK